MLCFFLLLSKSFALESRYCEFEYVNKDGKDLIIKKYVKNFDQYRQDTFEYEKEANEKIKQYGGHANIANFISAGECTLTFELVPGLDLIDFIFKYHPLYSRSQTYDDWFLMVKRIFKQVLEALVWLIDREIYNGDISPENIVVDPVTMKAHIIDFDHACVGAMEKDLPFQPGKAFYKPIEMQERNKLPCNRHKFPEKADVYMLGATLFTMLLGKCPHDPKRNYAMLWTGFSDTCSPYVRKHFASEPVPQESLDLLDHILVCSPPRRPCMKDILKHPYVAN